MAHGSTGQLESDEALAMAAAAGDEPAFEVLYRRYRRVAERSAARQARRLPQLDAEAATALALQRLWQSLRHYDPERPFAPWAAAVISRSVSTSAEAARSLKSRWNWWALLAGGGDGEDAEPLLERHRSADPSPLDHVLLGHEESVVAALIATTLSSLEATVLRLRLAGWSYEEIGVRLSREPKAVDNACSRGRAKLRMAVGRSASLEELSP